MQTDTLCQSITWGSSKHPPPLKPLPPLPPTSYLMLSRPSSNDSLLSHRVPSPTLRIDMMNFNSEMESYSSSTHSIVFSTVSSPRDSSSSIIEFAQSILPPTPQSIWPITPANSVECRLQHVDQTSKSNSFDSALFTHCDTSHQLQMLCSELENLQVKRRDSAIFDTTLPKRPSSQRPRIDTDGQIVTSAPQASCPINRLPQHLGSPIPTNTSLGCPPSSELTRLESGETSFIDWDDELPRLARVKKSLADLRSVGRARSNSAPMMPNSMEVSAMSKQAPTSIVAGCGGDLVNLVAIGPPSPKGSPTFRPLTPTKSASRRSLRRRRTILIFDNTNRLPRNKSQRTVCSTTTGSPKSTGPKYTSSPTCQKTHQPPRVLKKLTSWMWKLTQCSHSANE